MRNLIHHTPAIVVALGGSVLTVAAQATDYATVVSSTPVTAAVPVPRQVCSDARQFVQQQPSGAGSLIGAIAGGLLGNSVGAGFGRAAATGLGVVAGSVIGNRVEADTNPVAEVPVRRCRTVNNIETRVVGYDVMYDYAGQRYSTRMARDPGTQFAISLQPADGTARALPVPAEAEATTTPLPPAYYEPLPQTAYTAPTYTPYYAPYGYYTGPAVYAAPIISIGFGLGYYGGWRGGRHWR